MKYFDENNQRLVFMEDAATSDFWDRLWSDKELRSAVMSVRDGNYVERTTKKYLPPGSKILEGGCGYGGYVYALQRWGFDAHGVDFATVTINKVKKIFPNLNIISGDVRELPYPDSFFDGIWSFGVIEHFFEGFEEVAKEMRRVLKPGGFVFVTFPHMSWIRRAKSKCGLYRKFTHQIDTSRFYQFALSDNEVVDIFSRFGFIFCECMDLDGVKGLKDEVYFLRPILRVVYNSNFLPLKLVRRVLDKLFKKIASHSILLVFKL